MLKKTITYTDLNGTQRTEDFYFNYSKGELTEMELASGGLEAKLTAIASSNDARLIIDSFKEMLLGAYGQKSPDGRRFIKSKELAEEFSQCPAYSELMVELYTNPASVGEFFAAVAGIPQSEVALPATPDGTIAPLA